MFSLYAVQCTFNGQPLGTGGLIKTAGIKITPRGDHLGVDDEALRAQAFVNGVSVWDIEMSLKQGTPEFRDAMALVMQQHRLMGAVPGYDFVANGGRLPGQARMRIAEPSSGSFIVSTQTVWLNMPEITYTTQPSTRVFKLSMLNPSYSFGTGIVG